MTFRIALSGINAASSDLGVTANNIANANTNGFKASRAEFADVYAAGAQGLAARQEGSGVRVSAAAQQFGQGSIDFTDNPLDLAINGQGFFTVSDGGERAFTRAGAFSVDRDGFVVNAAGQQLQAFPPTAAGGFATGGMQSLRIDAADNPPQASGQLTLSTNLPAAATPPTTTPLDPLDPDTYNHTTSMTVYDSLGTAHTASMYYVKDAATNAWNVHTYVDGTAVGGANALTYDSAGALVTPANGQITLPTHALGNGAADLALTMDVSDSTQFGETFGVSALTQDGYSTGRLSGLEVTDAGVVQVRYTNGQVTALGQLAIANFANPQGLVPKGDNHWTESFDSGAARLGAAGSSDLGAIQSGALEGSNVDLTEQLVNMITAQRNFQANAQMISTSDQVTQTIINIR